MNDEAAVNKDLLLIVRRIVRYGRKFDPPTPEFMSLKRQIQIADNYLTDKGLHPGQILRTEATDGEGE